MYKRDMYNVRLFINQFQYHRKVRIKSQRKAFP